jgi:hypothetical protein
MSQMSSKTHGRPSLLDAFGEQWRECITESIHFCSHGTFSQAYSTTYLVLTDNAFINSSPHNLHQATSVVKSQAIGHKIHRAIKAMAIP